MGASSYHATDQEWDLVKDFGHEVYGSFVIGPSPTAEEHRPSPDVLCRASTSVTNPEYQKSQDYSGNHCSITVQSFDMGSNLTAEEVERARELNRMDDRAKSLAWAFGGIHKNDDHKASSSKPADPPPQKYAEEDRQKLRVEYLAWMFGGVYVDNAHEDWSQLSSADKEALRAKLSGDQPRSDEQVGQWRYEFLLPDCVYS